MIVAIQPDKTKQGSYSDRWKTYLEQKGIQVRMVDLFRADAIEQLRGADALLWRTVHAPDERQLAQKILYTVEKYLGIPVFPDHQTYWFYDEKITQFYMLNALGVKMPKTWIFWREDEALAWIEQASFPLVFKLSAGASSQNVKLANSKADAKLLVKRMFGPGIYPENLAGQRNLISGLNKNILGRLKIAAKVMLFNELPEVTGTWLWRKEKNYAYFQEFVPNNDGDTRVTVIGERIFGFRRFNRKDDFRASGSGKLDMAPEGVDPRCLKIAYDVSKKLNCQSMAYDFLFLNGEPVLSEISYTYVADALAACPGYWTPAVNWVKGSFYPQDLILEDFLLRFAARLPDKGGSR